MPDASRPLPAAVLWDMDGTLVDTDPLWFAAEQGLAARHGVPWTREDSAHLVGMPMDAYGGLMVAAGVPLTVDEVIDELVGMVAERLLAELVWRPGARELLATLAGAGVPCAMVTMSYRGLAQAVAGAAGEGAFRVLVTGQDVTQGKPHPEPYRTAAAALGAQPDRCVAIEDSPPGIASAIAAGARTIGVPHLAPVPAAAGLSRVASLADLTLADLAAVAGGVVIDRLGEAATA